MAEAVGLTASIIAIVELSVKVTKLCLDYSIALRSARESIGRLHSQVKGLSTTLQEAKRVIESPNGQSLTASQKLLDSLDGCASELDRLWEKLDNGTAKKAIRRFGIRALKWPFNMQEVTDIVSRLERYERTIHLGLQVDQTTILLDIRQQMENVSLQPGDNFRPNAKPCFSVPFGQDTHFVDRPDIMRWIKEQYAGPNTRMALVGMGGFGKSQVAIQFAHQIHSESPGTSVFWVHASSAPRFEEAYWSIANRLQLPGRNDPLVNELVLVRDWLQRDEVGPWLMILDNADDVNLFYPRFSAAEAGTSPNLDTHKISEQQLLASFLPKRGNGTILITSRSLDVAEKMTGTHKAIYNVSTMGKAQSLQLFQNKVKDRFNEDTAADLLLALNHIPIAITQAAAYINRRRPRVTVESYLDDFRNSEKKKGSLLNSDAGDLRRDESVSNSVVVTWQATFEQVRREKPTAADLLSFMSFFQPQGIPEFMACKYPCISKQNGKPGDEDEPDDEQFDADLDVLRGYSLISVTAASDTFEMHPLVQFCTQSWLSSVGDIELWKRAYLHAMVSFFPHGNFENWSACQLLFPHLESIVESKPLEKDLTLWSALVANCAYYMIIAGSYKSSENLCKKALEVGASTMGSEQTVIITAALSVAIGRQGRTEEARKLSSSVMEIYQRTLGNDHPSTLASMATVAASLGLERKWEEAEALCLQILDRGSKVLAEDHPLTLGIKGQLSTIWGFQLRQKEAEALRRLVFENQKRVRGPEHLDTLISLRSLGGICSSQERWDEAEELQKQAFEKCLRGLGVEHPYTLTVMYDLAVTRQRQGRHDEAEKLLVQVTEKRGRILGAENPDTLKAMSILAKSLGILGRYDQSEKLLGPVIEKLERIPEAENSGFLTALRSLASDIGKLRETKGSMTKPRAY